MEFIYKLIAWSNNNSGFVGVLIFAITIAYGFASGIFRNLRHRPRFKIELIEGPTLCSTFLTGRKFNGHEAHMTAFSLYLDITNIGSAASSVGEIHIGYHNDTFRYYFLWFWLKNETIALSEFMVDIGPNIKVFPFLKQGNPSLSKNIDSFLEVGKNVNGIVYFEQRESWGSFRPQVKNNKVKIKVRIKDSFGGSHSRILFIPNVTLDEARIFNPKFGTTHDALDSNNNI